MTSAEMGGAEPHLGGRQRPSWRGQVPGQGSGATRGPPLPARMGWDGMGGRGQDAKQLTN